MTKDEVFAVIRKNIVDGLCTLNGEDIRIDATLKDLGANSLDRADIVLQSMEELNVKMSLVEVGTVRNLEELVDLFYAKMNAL